MFDNGDLARSGSSPYTPNIICGYACVVLTCSEIEVTKGDNKILLLKKDGDYAILTKNVRMATKILTPKDNHRSTNIT